MYNILVVEDEYLSREVMKKIILEEFNNKVEVMEASNGIKAKDIIDNKYTHIDIIIMDINMPGINGIELSKYVRSKLKNIPIIAVTGYDEYDIEKTIVKLNINEYLLKPVRASKIIEVIKKYLNKEEINTDNKENTYLKKLSKSFIECSYKDSIEIVKHYVDFLYKDDNINYNPKEIITLTKCIEEACKKTNICIPSSTIKKIENIKQNYIFYNNDKYIIKDELSKIINEIFRVIHNNDNSSNEVVYSGYINNYTKDIINYVEINIKKNITLEDVANHINLSTHYLSKIFKKEVGVNFTTYLTDRRIELAKEMLTNENTPIVNIAIELSYSKPNYFSKVFKNKVGITPTEYREGYLKNKKDLKE